MSFFKLMQYVILISKQEPIMGKINPVGVILILLETVTTRQWSDRKVNKNKASLVEAFSFKEIT